MEPYKKDDDEQFYTFPFQNLEPTSVLQESREFNNTPIKSRQCILIITKLLYILGQGIHFSRLEATDVFFNSTKLFISDDVSISILIVLNIYIYIYSIILW